MRESWHSGWKLGCIGRDLSLGVSLVSSPQVIDIQVGVSSGHQARADHGVRNAVHERLIDSSAELAAGTEWFENERQSSETEIKSADETSTN